MLGGMNKALIAKLAILAVITAMLCVVLAQIGGLVDERRARQHEAEQSVEQSQAGPQTLLGPLLTRSCKETWLVAKDVAQNRSFTVVLPPSQLQVGGRAQSVARKHAKPAAVRRDRLLEADLHGEVGDGQRSASGHGISSERATAYVVGRRRARHAMRL